MSKSTNLYVIKRRPVWNSGKHRKYITLYKNKKGYIWNSNGNGNDFNLIELHLTKKQAEFIMEEFIKKEAKVNTIYHWYKLVEV